MGALTPSNQRFVLAVAARVVPASVTYSDADRAACLRLVDETLASRPAAMQRQFATFLRVLRWAPALRYGHPLDRLEPSDQDRVLRWFQRCPLQRVRSGFWGVRTLVLIGCYGRPDAGPAMGYTPSRDGNAVLHARARR